MYIIVSGGVPPIFSIVCQRFARFSLFSYIYFYSLLYGLFSLILLAWIWWMACVCAERDGKRQRQIRKRKKKQKIAADRLKSHKVQHIDSLLTQTFGYCLLLSTYTRRCWRKFLFLSDIHARHIHNAKYTYNTRATYSNWVIHTFSTFAVRVQEENKRRIKGTLRFK